MFLIAYDTLASHPVAREIKPVALGLADLAQVLTRFSWTETELVFLNAYMHQFALHDYLRE